MNRKKQWKQNLEYRAAQVKLTVVSTPKLECSKQGKLYIQFTSDITEGDDTISAKKDVEDFSCSANLLTESTRRTSSRQTRLSE